MIVVVGAGAAGLLAALFAARAGASVCLLETRPKPGAKIRVSGGGRCNILPSEVALEDFHTGGSSHTLRNVLFSWPLAEVRAFFEQDLGIALKRESTGKIFPVSERPQDVVEALLRACARAGVRLECGFRVTELRRIENPSLEAHSDPAPGDGAPARATRFEVIAADGRCEFARRLILATGGLSLPKTGSDGHGLAMVRELGIPLRPTYPALVPLLVPDPRWRALSGIAVPALLRAWRAGRVLEERERDLLFTHRGVSGPVVLDMSRHVAAPDAHDVELRIQWDGRRAPDWEQALRPAGRRQVATLLRAHFPDRLASLLVDLAGVAGDRRLSDVTRIERQRLVAVLQDCPLPTTGTEGYGTAEVTAGGVPLESLHAKTLESRSVPGLYLCGEMLDVVGHIGGYNFLWAWVTGRKAGLSAAARE